jgi:hypothetical protein
MADSIKVTDNIRGFLHLIYAETAASIEQLFTIEELPSVLDLEMVRVCCGSEDVNRVADGYALPDHTPWLAELCFGKDIKGISRDKITSAGYNHSPVLTELSCRSLQGVGASWGTVFAQFNLDTLSQVAQCPQSIQIQIKNQTKSFQILEFVAKARIALSPPPPLPRTILDGLKISTAVWLSPGEAVSQVGQFEEKDWEQVVNYLTGLFAVLNDSSIKSLTLREVLG